MVSSFMLRFMDLIINNIIVMEVTKFKDLVKVEVWIKFKLVFKQEFKVVIIDFSYTWFIISSIVIKDIILAFNCNRKY